MNNLYQTIATLITEASEAILWTPKTSMASTQLTTSNANQRRQALRPLQCADPSYFYDKFECQNPEHLSKVPLAPALVPRCLVLFLGGMNEGSLVSW